MSRDADLAAEAGHFATTATNVDLAGDHEQADAIREGVSALAAPAVKTIHLPGVYHYRPIADLPDVKGVYVVLYNHCNGPYLQELVLDDDAAYIREDGCWEYFIILPIDPDDLRAASA